jgi:hypothetical protein
MSTKRQISAGCPRWVNLRPSGRPDHTTALPPTADVRACRAERPRCANSGFFYRGAGGIADEWWSTIIQFSPSFTSVKL